MQKVRITITHNPEDPSADLRIAARLRRDLWAHSPVEIDPGGLAHGTHRDESRNAYFEFVTDYLPEVERVFEEYGYKEQAKYKVVQEGDGTECVNCGHIASELDSVCPECKFCDIEPCPYCNSKIPRLAYLPVNGDVFKCPKCHHQIRMEFHEPLFDSNGNFNQPLVRVSKDEAPVNNGV